jgi:hypothetical protein
MTHDIIVNEAARWRDGARQVHGSGVVKSLELTGSGPVGLVRTQDFSFFKRKNPLRGRMLQHNVNLAGLFRNIPIAGLKNCYARLQEGKIIAMGN